MSARAVGSTLMQAHSSARAVSLSTHDDAGVRPSNDQVASLVNGVLRIEYCGPRVSQIAGTTHSMLPNVLEATRGVDGGRLLSLAKKHRAFRAHPSSQTRAFVLTRPHHVELFRLRNLKVGLFDYLDSAPREARACAGGPLKAMHAPLSQQLTLEPLKAYPLPPLAGGAVRTASVPTAEALGAVLGDMIERSLAQLNGGRGAGVECPSVGADITYNDRLDEQVLRYCP